MRSPVAAFVSLLVVPYRMSEDAKHLNGLYFPSTQCCAPCCCAAANWVSCLTLPVASAIWVAHSSYRRPHHAHPCIGWFAASAAAAGCRVPHACTSDELCRVWTVEVRSACACSLEFVTACRFRNSQAFQQTEDLVCCRDAARFRTYSSHIPSRKYSLSGKAVKPDPDPVVTLFNTRMLSRAGPLNFLVEIVQQLVTH